MAYQDPRPAWARRAHQLGEWVYRRIFPQFISLAGAGGTEASVNDFAVALPFGRSRLDIAPPPG